MPDRIIYFYRRENQWGYDQVSILAFSQEQADQLLRTTVVKPEEFSFDHLMNLDARIFGYDENREYTGGEAEAEFEDEYQDGLYYAN